MVEDDRLKSWGPRLLAPLAFFVAATVLILVIQSALNAEGASQTTAPTTTQPEGPTTTAGEAGTTTERTKPKKKKRTYRVQSGDTLDSIAARFDTTTADLLELNPDIDPLSLTVGQQIRVR